MKFKLNDKVRKNKIGQPTNGVVIGVMQFKLWEVFYRPDLKNFTRYDVLYPNWKQEDIYFVQLESPERPLTLEKFIQQTGKTEVEYQLLPGASIVFHPEADLIKL